ncbi:N-acyl homoserine lactonase family protein [Parasphingopyxis sp. CP4]|uniref:N-acyl homoserine lactonase family protein n=1 Tax=Parasphingopyxis sp. CP4 TaxID=2724527 RepID=UPI0015A3C26E|nr:N-acyl homoserine lactonase family protein [Parasphingopyxis sp. CP4]QLC22028.1 N-acyl homoserine lactonase family protein [Parasphingopyxis sp. CP4]
MGAANGGVRHDGDEGVLLFAFTCGYITLPMGFFLEGEPGKVKVPACSYLIDHPKGLALFDTGFSPRFTDMADGLGKIVDMPKGESIADRLTELNVDPARIDWIINSHLHLDHAGGNALIPNATVIVQSGEWDFGLGGEDGAYHAVDFDTGQPVKQVSGEHDLFGDGSVVLFPTPGHTPGHQSVRVQTGGGEAILCGDCCNMRQSLDEMHLPDHAWSLDACRNSLELLSKLRDKGARIFYGHDPEFWSGVPQSEALQL